MDRSQSNASSANDFAFYQYCQEKIILPELEDENLRKSIVPLRFQITSAGKPENIEFDPSYSANRNYCISDHHLFLQEGKRLINTFENWPKREMEMSVKIYFHYSAAYFNPNNNIVLNPDSKAHYIGDTHNYEYTILGKRGCDGIVYAILVVEPSGEITNFECIQAIGKTNCQVGEYELRKLGNWQPAIHQHQKARSQLYLSIYT